MENEIFVLALSLTGAPVSLPFIPRVLFCPCLSDSSYGQLAVKDTLSVRRDAVKVRIGRGSALSVDVHLDSIEVYCTALFIKYAGEESTLLVLSNVADLPDKVRELYGDHVICCSIGLPPSVSKIRIPLARLCYRSAQYVAKGVDRAIRTSAMGKQLLIETNVR